MEVKLRINPDPSIKGVLRFAKRLRRAFPKSRKMWMREEHRIERQIEQASELEGELAAIRSALKGKGRDAYLSGGLKSMTVKLFSEIADLRASTRKKLKNLQEDLSYVVACLWPSLVLNRIRRCALDAEREYRKNPNVIPSYDELLIQIASYKSFEGSAETHISFYPPDEISTEISEDTR